MPSLYRPPLTLKSSSPWKQGQPANRRPGVPSGSLVPWKLPLRCTPRPPVAVSTKQVLLRSESRSAG